LRTNEFLIAIEYNKQLKPTREYHPPSKFPWTLDASKGSLPLDSGIIVSVNICASSSTGPIQTTELAILLTNAYHVARQGRETEWVLLSALGAALRQLNPSFQATYGKQSLSTKLKQYPELFETQQREIGNGHAEEVRLRQHLHEKA